MTFAQSKQFVLGLLRKTPLFWRGFKSTEFGPGLAIYCPYIPLFQTATLDEARRHLEEDRLRAVEHERASINVDLTVR